MENDSAPSGPKTRIPLKIEETLAGIAIGLLGVITFANVVVRYLTNFSFAFTEEFSVFLMIFMALVGGSSVMAKQGHLNITYLVDKLSPPVRRKSSDRRHPPDRVDVPAAGGFRNAHGLG